MPSKLSQKEFLRRLSSINENYCNEKFEVISLYESAHSKIRLKDNFGEYLIRASDLLKGSSNPSIKNVIKKEKYLLKKFNFVHKNKFTYPVFKYVSYKQKIKIKCKDHGIFKQKIENHVNGNGCPKCAKNIDDFDSVVIKANEVHSGKYKYPLQIYKNNKQKLKIECPIHGYFQQVCEYHLSGCGCQKCGKEGRRANKGGYNSTIIERHKNEYKKLPCKLYFIKMSNEKETFYKIGITVESSLKKRISNMSSKYKKEVIEVIEDNLYDCFYAEKDILVIFKKFKYTPKERFSGRTECFSKNIFKERKL